MEKRVVLLVILCVLVFVGWSLLIKAIYPPPPPGPPAPPAPPPTSRPMDGGQDDAKLEPRQDDEPEKLVTLANDKVELILTNRGAGIQEGSVKVPNQKPMRLLQVFDPSPIPAPHLAITALDSADDTARMGWSEKEGASEAGRSITYVFKLRNGVDIEKKFVLEPGRNEVEMVLTLRHSRPEKPEPVRLKLTVLTGLAHDSPYRYEYYGHGFVTTMSSGSRATQAVSYDAPVPKPGTENQENPPRLFPVEIPGEERSTRHVEWLGLRNRYAAVVLLTREDHAWVDKVNFRATQQGEEKLKALAVDADLRVREVGGQPHMAHFALVLAPVRRDDLRAIPGGEDYLLSYGCWGLFNPIGRLILWLIGVMYSIVGNFGWAIIFTTLAIRLALFPLTKKSQVSMARMAALQPKLNALREKYPDDPPRQQQETMKLFKQHGVNPLSGCFPILLQLPVFIGLYSVLDISLEFRQAPFIGWIDDLSQPDRLVEFPTVDLWVTSFSEFNLLPIVMTVTWFLQSYYAPRPQDPKLAAQQKMMMFMPVIFGLFCYSLASGLSLYLFVNSLLAMIEQKIIKKYVLPAQAPAAPPVKA